MMTNEHLVKVLQETDAYRKSKSTHRSEKNYNKHILMSDSSFFLAKTTRYAMMMGKPKPTKLQKKYNELDDKFGNQAKEIEMLKSALGDARKIGEANENYEALFNNLVARKLIDQSGNPIQFHDHSQNSQQPL